MKAKPTFKIVDDKGRVLIPKALRAAAETEHDIVRLGIQKGVITAKKVDLIEIGDQSPEALEAFVHAAVRDMPDEHRNAKVSAPLLYRRLRQQFKPQRTGSLCRFPCGR